MVAAGVVICILAMRRCRYRELFGLSREDDAAR